MKLIKFGKDERLFRDHTLKIDPEPFRAIVEGRKRFEFRQNDRDFKVGDVLMLKEYSRRFMEYSGRFLFVKVTYLCNEVPGVMLIKNANILSISDPMCIGETSILKNQFAVPEDWYVPTWDNNWGLAIPIDNVTMHSEFNIAKLNGIEFPMNKCDHSLDAMRYAIKSISRKDKEAQEEDPAQQPNETCSECKNLHWSPVQVSPDECERDYYCDAGHEDLDGNTCCCSDFKRKRNNDVNVVKITKVEK